ncbi:MAG TPA: type II secretion system protein GspM [Roseiarcus sp.]|jgi:general secretion pathway protein M
MIDWIRQNAHARRQALSALVYTVAVFGLAGYAITATWSVVAAHADVDALSERLAALKAHTHRGAGAGANAAHASPFLHEATVTLAGAALQQRVEQAVAKAGGSLQSDEEQLDSLGDKDGFIRLTANFDLTQAGLQPLLYDLEAGMPYLFVESLDIQSPEATGEAEAGPMHVALTVSSKWEPGL